MGRTIFYGYLDGELTEETEFELEVFGERHDVTRVDAPLYDPDNVRLKA